MGGCAGACRLLLHSVVSLSPQALMQPGACGHDSTYLTRANGCPRRPRAWAWGNITHLVRCRAVGGKISNYVHLSPSSDTGTSQRPASSSAHGRWNSFAYLEPRSRKTRVLERPRPWARRCHVTVTSGTDCTLHVHHGGKINLRANLGLLI
jgi:hypothetical protein